MVADFMASIFNHRRGSLYRRCDDRNGEQGAVRARPGDG